MIDDPALLIGQPSTCSEPIEYLVPWGGELIDCCRYHCVALLKVSYTIGSPIQVKRHRGGPCKMPDDFNADDKREINKQLVELTAAMERSPI